MHAIAWNGLRRCFAAILPRSGSRNDGAGFQRSSEGEACAYIRVPVTSAHAGISLGISKNKKRQNRFHEIYSKYTDFDFNRAFDAVSIADIYKRLIQEAKR
jgi:hypothetical protein